MDLVFPRGGRVNRLLCLSYVLHVVSGLVSGGWLPEDVQCPQHVGHMNGFVGFKCSGALSSVDLFRVHLWHTAAKCILLTQVLSDCLRV